MLHELGAAHHAPGVARQVVKEGEFLRGERDLPSPPRDQVAGGVDHEVADDEPGREHLAASPGEGAEPGQELAEVERLGEVVVGAGVEPRDALLDRIEGGEHEDGDGAAGGADCLADLEPGGPRHQDVEDDDVVVVLARQGQRLGAIGGEVDDVRRLAQAAGDGLAQLTVILGEQDAHGRRWSE